MKFAKVVFLIAGIWGLIIIPPMYFLEQRIGRDAPPAITHPEYFYGFIGVTLAFQIVFLVLSRDPVRYRPLMPACMVEKATFSIACLVLYFQGRIPSDIALFGLIDFTLGVLFLAAYLKTGMVASRTLESRSNISIARGKAS